MQYNSSLILLFYYSTILLFYYSTILLFYYSTILLFYYSTILLSTSLIPLMSPFGEKIEFWIEPFDPSFKQRLSVIK